MLATAYTNYWVTWFPGAVLATLGVLALIWRAVTWLSNSTRTIKQVQLALPDILAIRAEFNPNHGSSMKDRVEALHDKQDTLGYDTRKWQREHARDDDRRFGKVEGSLERIEDKLSP